MKNKEIIAWILNGLGVVGTAIQTEAVFRVISLILTIIATLLSIGITCWSWWLKAKKDGKLTPEELEELKKKLEEEKERIDK